MVGSKWNAPLSLPEIKLIWVWLNGYESISTVVKLAIKCPLLVCSLMTTGPVTRLVNMGGLSLVSITQMVTFAEADNGGIPRSWTSMVSVYSKGSCS